MHHHIQKLFRRKKNASMKLKAMNLSLERIHSLRKLITVIKNEISVFYMHKIQQDESEAWGKMRSNLQFFFTFAFVVKGVISN